MILTQASIGALVDLVQSRLSSMAISDREDSANGSSCRRAWKNCKKCDSQGRSLRFHRSKKARLRRCSLAELLPAKAIGGVRDSQRAPALLRGSTRGGRAPWSVNDLAMPLGSRGTRAVFAN